MGIENIKLKDINIWQSDKIAFDYRGMRTVPQLYDKLYLNYLLDYWDFRAGVWR